MNIKIYILSQYLSHIKTILAVLILQRQDETYKEIFSNLESCRKDVVRLNAKLRRISLFMNRSLWYI